MAGLRRILVVVMITGWGVVVWAEGEGDKEIRKEGVRNQEAGVRR